jgi:hypothetical protein
MSFETWWLLFGVPLLTMLIAWIGLVSRWRTIKYRAMRLLVSIAMIFPTAAALLACGGLAYVQRGGIVHDALGFYGNGFLVSLTGVLLGVAVAIALRRWFSLAALAVSTWMFLLFALMASAAD